MRWGIITTKGHFLEVLLYGGIVHVNHFPIALNLDSGRPQELLLGTNCSYPTPTKKMAAPLCIRRTIEVLRTPGISSLFSPEAIALLRRSSISIDQTV